MAPIEGRRRAGPRHSYTALADIALAGQFRYGRVGRGPAIRRGLDARKEVPWPA
jgi:hypothetical protein